MNDQSTPTPTVDHYATFLAKETGNADEPATWLIVERAFEYAFKIGERELAAANSELAAAQALAETLKQEAIGHAHEARCANHTIAEIYQLCSGGTGEPGNWNGAQPVRDFIAAAQAREQRMREALKNADSFITNGIELGFIRMPDDDCRDPAKEVPGFVKAVLSLATDTTALDAVRKEERERAAILCETELATNDGISCAEAIRAMGEK